MEEPCKSPETEERLRAENVLREGRILRYPVIAETRDTMD
jgi:hypothetical protein